MVVVGSLVSLIKKRKKTTGSWALGALAMWSATSPLRKRRLKYVSGKTASTMPSTVTPSPATYSKATKNNYDYLRITRLPSMTDESKLENIFCGLYFTPKEEGNVLLPFEELRQVIEGILCDTCRTGKLVAHAWTKSFASSVSVLCTNPSCGVWRNAKASRSQVFDREVHRLAWKTQPADRPNNHDVLDPFDAYDINLEMVLTMQQMGKAEAAFESIRSALGIESTGVHGYSTYEQKISLTHI
jgi:hypothetical protein